MFDYIGAEIIELGRVLESEQPPAVRRFVYNRLLELTESLGVLVDESAPEPPCAAWDDPIWPEGSKVGP